MLLLLPLLACLLLFDGAVCRKRTYEDEMDEEEFKKLDLKQKVKKYSADTQKKCCRSCVQEFDWGVSPGSIECDEQFGPLRKCNGHCLLLVVKHVVNSKTTTTTTTTTTKDSNETTTTVSAKKKNSRKEKPLIWRFCSKKAKTALRLASTMSSRPHAANCDRLKSLMFVDNLVDMDKVLDENYFSERIEPSMHLIDCERATFHQHRHLKGEMRDGVLDDDCAVIPEEYGKSYCHEYDSDGALLKRKLNFTFCRCLPPLNATKFKEDYDKKMDEIENTVHYFDV